MKRMFYIVCVIGLLLVAVLAVPCHAVSINGYDAVFKSTGGDGGSGAWNLWANGYLGTFIHLDQPGTVQATVNAKGSYAAGAWPQMDLHIGDLKANWAVSSASYLNYTANFALPAGTFFVRNEFLNDYYDGVEDRNLYIQSLTFTGSAGTNLTINNTTTQVTAASDSYIENYRKGPALVTITNGAGTPLGAGVPVQVSLRQHAFNFGVPIDSKQLAGTNPTYPDLADLLKYQDILKQNFNMYVPENDGKWVANEYTRDVVTMTKVDADIAYAAANNKGMRMHTLTWAFNGTWSPTWVNTLYTNAAAGDTASKVDLRAAINSRIQYYVTDRAAGYSQLDVVNETGHGATLDNALRNVGDPVGAGVGWVYNQTAAALDSLGSAGNARMYFNDYGALDTASNYGEWYRANIQTIRNNISPANWNRLGIGVQDWNWAPTSNVDVFKTLQNLDSFEYPISLTEFGVPDSTTLETAAATLREHMRMVFGNDMTDTFVTWGFWKPAMWVGNLGAYFYDAYWNITESGKTWQQMLGIYDWGLTGVPKWDTDLSLITDANSQINFNGFYGDYDVTVAGTTVSMTLANGTGNYTVAVQVALPAQVASPTPANGATSVPITQQLGWGAASGATSYDVYFGTTSPGTFKVNTTSTSFNPGTLSYNTTYYWRIDSKNGSGTTTGIVWSFTTVPAPELLTNPSFTTDANGWEVYSTVGATGLRTTVVYDTSPAGYKITTTSKGVNSWDTQFYTTNGMSITSGKSYKLRFRAKATTGFTIPKVELQKNVSLWNAYYSTKTSSSLAVTTGWVTYQVSFVANITASDARINFYLGAALPKNSTFYIDTLSFKQVN